VRVIFPLPPDPASHEIFAPGYRVLTKLERVSIRPWSPTTVEYFPPLAYLGSPISDFELQARISVPVG
jgi:hypothetical protein